MNYKEKYGDKTSTSDKPCAVTAEAMKAYPPDVEQVLDSYIFVNQGKIIRAGSVDEAREETGGSLDQLFREVFRCLPNY